MAAIRNRGYVLDLSRGKVPTMATFGLLAELLARHGYTRLTLNGGTPFPLPAAGIEELDARCGVFGIEVEALGEPSGSPCLPPVRPFDRTNAAFAATAAGGSLSGRVEDMREDTEAAWRAAVSRGLRTYVVTDFARPGHWEPLAASLPGIVLGGAFAREGERAARMDLEGALDAEIGVPLGGVLLRLGTLYLRGGAPHAGGSELFRILSGDRGYSRHPGLTESVLAEISAVAEGCRHAASAFVSATLYGPSAVWAQEIAYMANLVDAACHRRDEGRLLALKAEHRRVWLTRNGPDGLEASSGLLPRF